MGRASTLKGYAETTIDKCQKEIGRDNHEAVHEMYHDSVKSEVSARNFNVTRSKVFNFHSVIFAKLKSNY